MQLKRFQDVHYLELARIELPFFAKQFIETHIDLNDFGTPRIAGLDTVICDPLDPGSHKLNENTYSHLLQRVAQGEVILVHEYGDKPMIPLMTRVTGERGESWRIDSSLSHEQRFNTERMLTYAEATRGLWQPVERLEPDTQPSAPVEHEQPKEITVTNPRWEHVDEQCKKDREKQTMAGDTITLKVDVTGVPDGTRVTFKIFDTSITPRGRIAVVRGEVEGGIGSAEWEVKVRRDGIEPEFEGEVRRLISEPAEIPVVEEVKFIFSF